MRRPIRLLPLALLVLAGFPGEGRATELGRYRFDPGGRVRGVRVIDVNADGRKDLVVLLEKEDGAEEILIARTPKVPTARTYFPSSGLTRIPCSVGTGVPFAGVVAVGRFGPKGEVTLRFLGADDVYDVRPDGRVVEPPERDVVETLFARSPGQKLLFWDAVHDLDGDGIDELWYPLAEGDGPIRVHAGSPRLDRVLALTANNIGASSDAMLLERHAYVPNLFPADLDGDGRKELVSLDGSDLVAWELTGKAAGRLEPAYRVHLPFLDPDPKQGADEMRVPRVQLADVDGDGTTDLLVTLLTGTHGKLESLRTILFHYPGPIRDAETGKLVKPRARIDTQSIVLHPQFVDVDRDGDLDYVGDSMRGTQFDLIARLMGQDPKITYVGFRFDERKGTFEDAPYFTVERLYASSETLSNRFGRAAWFGGDFDGDGHGDLFDLGNLQEAEILRGVRKKARSGGHPLEFEPGLLHPVAVKEGLVADARVTDLDGDGRSDAVLWSAAMMYLVVPKGPR